ncbi:MAG: acid phosphatase [Deltaproteobacteria bacterium]|nr:acid phosphatase [Deltaproteobacteria bacterium]
MRRLLDTRRTPVATIAVAALMLAACGPAAPVVGDDPPGRVRLSFFAFGDAGAFPNWFRSWQPQMRVGAVLEAEQRRRPADALVMLGDNFYPDGLLEKELEYRVRENVVRPYCVFLALDGPESSRVANACGPAHRGERPIPFYAVLGNHDLEVPESPRLQREIVPRFVPNWHVPAQSVEVIELADSELNPGVSLILYDALALAERDDAASLERALREAHGPWRILANHYPIQEKSHPGPWIQKALAGIDVPVHLHLAGHDHNLQIGVPAPQSPYLQVVAGSGGGERAARHALVGGRFAMTQPGFARIDLVGDGETARLVVSLVALPVSNLAVWVPARVVARWSVGLGGDVREEALAKP